MPLQRQELVIPLGTGMNESVPRELLPTDQLHDVQNGRVRKPGQLEKRYGYELIAQGIGSTVDGVALIGQSIEALLSRDDELAAVSDGNNLYSYSTSRDQWAFRGMIPEAQAHKRFTAVQAYATGNVTAATAARIGDYLAVCWDGAVNVAIGTFCRVFDLRTGSIISEFSDVSDSNVLSRVIAVGSRFVIVRRANASNPFDITANSLDTAAATLAWSSTATLTTTASVDSTSAFDVYPLTSNDFVLAQVEDTGGELNLFRFSASTFALVDSELNIRAGKTIGTNGAHVSVVVISSTIYVAFWNDTDGTVEVKGHSATTLAQTFAAQVAATLTPDPSYVSVGPMNSTSDAWVIWDINTAGTTTDMPGFGWRAVSGGGSLGTVHDQRALILASRPFQYGDYSYVVAITGYGHISGAQTQIDQAAFLVLDLGAPDQSDANYRCRPIARFGEGESIGATTIRATPIISSDGTDPYAAYFAFPVLDSNFVWTIGVSSGIVGATADVVQLKFPSFDETSTHWAGSSGFGKNQAIPAGLIHHYDGDQVREFFAYYPWIDQINLTNTGANSLTVGTQYDYCICYVVIDSQGRKWRSRPSIVRSGTTTAGNQTIRLRIAPYTTTNQETNFNRVGIEIYRRSAASDPLVRLFNSSLGSVLISNKLATAFLEVSDDGAAFTVNSSSPNLYTTGGVLEAFTPPPCSQSVVFDNRLWIFNGNTLWYTREMLPDEGPAFHPAQVIDIGDAADIVALAVMDSNLVVFKAESIFFIQGIGPDDTGAGASYSVPQRIMSPVGCIDVRTAVVGGRGTYFRSRRGIERLNRDLTVEYVGDKVEDSLGILTITSGVHVQRDNEIRFTVSGPNNDSSCLVYDEMHDLWTRDIFHGADVTSPLSAVSAGGSYYWLEQDSLRVYKETVDSYSDELWDGDSITDTWITLKIETGDISLGNPISELEWWRSMLFARRGGDHDLSIEVALSQNDSWQTARTWDATDIDSWMGVPIELAEALPTGQRGRSIRFRIGDLTDFESVPTKGPILYAIGLEYGVEGGLSRVPAGQRK